MISWEDVNNLEKQKLDLQVKLDSLIKSSNVSIDEINELKSEILYINKKIKKIIGANEYKNIEEVKHKKYGIDEKNKKNYLNFKNKIKKINPMKLATNRMIYLLNDLQKEVVNERVKVK